MFQVFRGVPTYQSTDSIASVSVATPHEISVGARGNTRRNNSVCDTKQKCAVCPHYKGEGQVNDGSSEVNLVS